MLRVVADLRSRRSCGIPLLEVCITRLDKHLLETAGTNDPALREGQTLMLPGASFHLHFFVGFYVLLQQHQHDGCDSGCNPLQTAPSEPHCLSPCFHQSKFLMCKSLSHSQELLRHSTAKYAMWYLQQKGGDGSKPTPDCLLCGLAVGIAASLHWLFSVARIHVHAGATFHQWTSIPSVWAVFSPCFSHAINNYIPSLSHIS